MRDEATTGLNEDQLHWLIGRVGESVQWDPRNTFSLLMAIVITLESYRTNLTQKQLAVFRSTTQSTVSRVIRRIEPTVARVMEEFCLAPDDMAKTATIIDGFLIPTGNRHDQDKLYSGKRGRYGVTAQAVADLDGRLLTVSEIFPGATHDLTAFRSCHLHEQLNHANTIADLGYLGSNMTLPIKKPQGRELNDDQIDFNQTISGIRAAVERAIAHLKNWKILATGYRRRLMHLQRTVHIITGLNRLRNTW